MIVWRRIDARRDSHCVARSYVVRRSTVLMLFWLFSLLMSFVLSPPERLEPVARVAYRPPPPFCLGWLDPAALLVLVESVPFGTVSMMKSSSSNSEKSTGISLRVFRGELAYIAAAPNDLAAVAPVGLLLPVVCWATVVGAELAIEDVSAAAWLLVVL